MYNDHKFTVEVFGQCHFDTSYPLRTVINETKKMYPNDRFIIREKATGKRVSSYDPNATGEM